MYKTFVDSSYDLFAIRDVTVGRDVMLLSARAPYLRRGLPKKTEARDRKPHRKEKLRLTRCTKSIFGACRKRKKSDVHFSLPSIILPTSNHRWLLLRLKAVFFLRTLVVWVSICDPYQSLAPSDLFFGGDSLVS